MTGQLLRRFLFILPILFFAAIATADAQSTISGVVKDTKGNAVAGASVYLDNTIDGATTDSTGNFSFTTEEAGAQTIVVTQPGMQNAGQPITVNGNVSGIKLKMKKSATDLQEVVISAGSFEAGADRNKSVLSTLDIVTTAGANADVIKAIQTLPGTQQQGTQTGLFVRGGDASEANVIVDGLVAQNAFFSSAPGVAARSRFSPWQFKGVSFSSGGYSARYGQAMSSVLELNTLDMPEKSTINMGLNMAGIYASGSKLWKNSGGDISANYTNLSPFYKVANTNVDYYNVPKGGSLGARYAWKPNQNGILKFTATANRFSTGVTIPDPEATGNDLNFGITNTNIFSNLSYRQTSKDNNWTSFAAVSYSHNIDDITWGAYDAPGHDSRLQARLEEKRHLKNHLNIILGTELQHFSFSKDFDSSSSYTFHQGYTETQIAGYLEAEWAPIYWLSLRPGVRYEHSVLLGKDNIAPRLAVGLRAGDHGQFNLATGYFYQNPDNQYLLYGYKADFQKAVHYIANYQFVKNERTLRLEVYYKDYQNLIREQSTGYNPNSFRTTFASIDNSGYGYATGAELFYRDRTTIKNFDYWISYSYIDTRRLYKNYLAEATPDFISDHNFSLVTKYWINKLNLSVNGTYSFASGRPYYNPASTGFLSDRTPQYHNLAFTVNYLTSIKKWFTVIYAGVDNATNSKNIFGYRYTADGTRYPMRPALYRSFFIGANFSLTEFNKDEL